LPHRIIFDALSIAWMIRLWAAAPAQVVVHTGNDLVSP